MSQVVVFRRREGIVPPVVSAEENRTVGPPLSEDTIEEWSLDPLLSNVWGVMKLAEKIDRKMQELLDMQSMSDLEFQSLRKDTHEMHTDISTVYRKLRNICENCMLEKLEDLVPGGRFARRPGDRLGRELPEPGSRSRSPRSRSPGPQHVARDHSDRSEPEVSSARATRGTETSGAAEPTAGRQPGDDEDADEPVEHLRERTALPPLNRNLNAVRLWELRGRDGGFQTHIGPSYGLRFYPRHIAECLATPVYTEVELRAHLQSAPRHTLEEMLVALAFPDSPNEARINRPLGIPVDMGVPPRVPPPRY